MELRPNLIAGIGGINYDFINDPLFAESYHLGFNTLKPLGEKAKLFLYDLWRVYICCWAANNVKNLPGDFVECGVNTGFLSRAIINYTDFSNLSKNFYLLDTWNGIPYGQISEQEKQLGFEEMNEVFYGKDIYDLVRETFKEFDNVTLIKGEVPNSLTEVKSKAVCYLSIDMNCAAPEVAAMEYFWEKLFPGAIVIFDDYGFSANGKGYINQKLALDRFAQQKEVQILSLPTGQGMIVKNEGTVKDRGQDNTLLFYYMKRYEINHRQRSRKNCFSR